MVCAAGSLPGDLHKLWRTRQPNGYHMEYGYSCMGYEIAGGLGVKMADPSREVYVMVGDGSFLMMASEIATSVQEGYKLNIVAAGQSRLLEHRRPVAGDRLARLRHGLPLPHRKPAQLDGEYVPVDFAALCQGYGARTVRARTREEFEAALARDEG